MRGLLIPLMLAVVALSGCAAEDQKAEAPAVEQPNDAEASGPVIPDATESVETGELGSLAINLSALPPIQVEMESAAISFTIVAVDADGVEAVADIAWNLTQVIDDSAYVVDAGTGSSGDLLAPLAAGNQTFILQAIAEGFGSATASQSMLVVPVLTPSVVVPSEAIAGSAFPVSANATGGLSQYNLTCTWSGASFADANACDTTATIGEGESNLFVTLSDTMQNVTLNATILGQWFHLLDDPSGDTALIGLVPVVMPALDILKMEAISGPEGITIRTTVESMEIMSAPQGTTDGTWKVAFDAGGTTAFVATSVDLLGGITCTYGVLGTGWSTEGEDGVCSIELGTPAIITVTATPGFLSSKGLSVDGGLSGLYGRAEASYSVPGAGGAVPDADVTEIVDY